MTEPHHPPVGEALAASQAADEFSFLAQDENYDGVLSRAEFDAGRSEHDRRIDPERFARYDRDGDGSITRSEYLAGLAGDREAAAQGPGEPPGTP